MFGMTVDLLKMLGVSLAAVIGFMVVLWAIYLFKCLVKIVDIGWAVGFVLAALVYFAMGEGYVWRKLLVLALVSIWSLRLVSYLFERFDLTEDSRYQQVMANARHPHLKALALYLLQGFLVVALSLPFALMSQNLLPFFSTYEVFGMLLWMGAVIGEAIADDQLYRFKLNLTNTDQVLDKGLWKHSRHPNYFFEWLVWIAYAVMAVSSPAGWLAVFSPLMMLYLLLKVSGIPPAEAEALRTKGEAYQEYQRRTSKFFPWFS